MKIKKKEAGIDFAKAAVAANFCETDPPAETRLPFNTNRTSTR